jgi:hypothetical protein
VYGLALQKEIEASITTTTDDDISSEQAAMLGE